jgi:hypothetical protein
MTKYVQINQSGYVTGIVDEPLLIGLFGGTRTKQVSDLEAEAIQIALTAHHKMAEGLHINDVVSSLDKK